MRIKKILSLLIAISMLFTMFTAVSFATDEATLVVSSASVKAGDTVKITVSAENNPGIAVAGIKVNYNDTALKLKDVTDGGIWGNAMHSDKRISPYTLFWSNSLSTLDKTANGVIATLTFEVPANTAAGDYDISLSYGYENEDIINASGNKVKFNLTAGKITVVKPEPKVATLALSDATAKIGKTVDVTVSAENNPGIAVAGIKVNYDNTALKLTNVADGGIWGASLHSDKLESPYTLFWNNSTAKEDITANGVLATLTFEILAGAEAKDYDITLSYDYEGKDIINANKENVKFDLEAGKITVTEGGETPATYDVVFVADGVTVATITKVVGETLKVADFPEVPVKRYHDGEWDIKTDITGATTVTAKYTRRTFEVKFLAEDGSVVETKTVNEGESLKAADFPEVPAKDYHDGAWDVTEDITEAKTVNAKYTRRTFVVTFVIDGEIFKEVTVNEGDSLKVADFPAAPAKDGYTFSWDTDEAVIAAKTVTGTYEEIVPEIATLAVSSGTAEIGKTVEVTVSAAKNPGIAVAGIKVNYDNTALKLTNVADGGIWGAPLHSDKLESPYTLFWNNSTAKEDITANGVLATLTFEVLAGAEAKDYDITLSYDYEGKDIINANKENVKFDLEAGKITVVKPEPKVATLAVSGGSAKAGETVDVTVTAANNPGIAVAGIKVNYDSTALKLKGVADGGIWGASLHSDKLESPYTLFWNNSTAKEDITANGVLATLTFEVLAGAEEKAYDITLSYDYEGKDIINANKENVKFDLEAGKITVTEGGEVPATYDVIFVADGVTAYKITKVVGETLKVADFPEVPAKDYHDGEWDVKTDITGAATVTAVYTRRTFKVTFIVDGEVNKELTVNEGESLKAADFPEVPVKRYHDGEWDIKTDITGATTVTAKYTRRTFEVKFLAEDGSVVETKTVNEGESLKAADFPEVPAKDYHDGAWDVTEDITEAKTVNPVYTRRTFEVKFLAEDGSVVETKTVNEGESLKVADFPKVPAKDYHDGAWSVTEDITEAKTVNPVYTRRTFVVTFVVDGETFKEVTVNEGESLKVTDFPNVPAKDGFVGTWDTSDDVTAAKTVNAVYKEVTPEPGKFTVIFMVDGVELKTFTINAGDKLAVADFPAVPAKEYYDAKWNVTEDITTTTIVNAVYTRRTFDVVFVADGATVATKTVNEGEKLQVADFPEVPVKDYHDGAWDVAEDIAEAKTVNAVYTRRTFEVKFLAEDGSVVETKTVNEGESLKVADFPEVPAKDYHDGAWDVTEDITEAKTVNPVYTRRTFEVKFLAEDGSVIETKTVNEGESLKVADFPAVPVKDYYNGAWSVTEDITEAKTVTPVYTRRTFDVVFVADDVTVATKTVNEGESLAYADFPAVPVKDGYEGVWDTTAEVTAAKTVTAKYFATSTESGKFKVIFVADGVEVATITKNVGETLRVSAFPPAPVKEHYDVMWSVTTDITTTTVVTAIYTERTFTVVFVADGKEVAKKVLTEGEILAVENFPAVPAKKGYTGVWDTTEAITDSKTVNAVYTIIPQAPGNVQISYEPTATDVIIKVTADANHSEITSVNILVNGEIKVAALKDGVYTATFTGLSKATKYPVEVDVTNGVDTTTVKGEFTTLSGVSHGGGSGGASRLPVLGGKDPVVDPTIGFEDVDFHGTGYCPSAAFTDISQVAWYHASVDYVVGKGLMNGMSETIFAPNANLTRAMLVTVLYRAEGEPAVNRSIPFEDVDLGAYYGNAVIWAKQNGIVKGIDENHFAPNMDITREQVAAIIYRYSTYKGMDAVTLEENLGFSDADEISEYAVSAMNWAVGQELIVGYEDNSVRPTNNITRAEMATVLRRFLSKFLAK